MLRYVYSQFNLHGTCGKPSSSKTLSEAKEIYINNGFNNLALKY